jgi:hypothetical protein
MTRRGHHRQPLAGTGIKLHRRLYWILLIIFTGVAASGALWSVLSDVLRREPDELQHVLMQVHGAFAFLSMMVLGMLVPQHIRFGWNAWRNRWSGGAMVGIATVLVLTGYALYYADEQLRDWSKWIHLGIGLLAIAAMPLHVWLGRHKRRTPRWSVENPDDIRTG